MDERNREKQKLSLKTKFLTAEIISGVEAGDTVTTGIAQTN
jgi:hypothetical protein